MRFTIAAFTALLAFACTSTLAGAQENTPGDVQNVYARDEVISLALRDVLEVLHARDFDLTVGSGLKRRVILTPDAPSEGEPRHIEPLPPPPPPSPVQGAQQPARPGHRDVPSFFLAHPPRTGGGGGRRTGGRRTGGPGAGGGASSRLSSRMVYL
ncbi:hypothetical protein EIP91_004028 [Steccherinum ochraceum]|uniref:Uncharacterized protein n=1 Tax=Steccherinum ochraceum TaxID=92696 RepID=A0A4R0R9J8_9APHY|nr:hypothetical protein EIP91_004028 [Steccherinum ochraceum]